MREVEKKQLLWQTIGFYHDTVMRLSWRNWNVFSNCIIQLIPSSDKDASWIREYIRIYSNSFIIIHLRGMGINMTIQSFL